MSMTGITLDKVGGLLTEKSVWQMLFDLTGNGRHIVDAAPQCIWISEDGHFAIDSTTFRGKGEKAFRAPEWNVNDNDEKAGVWTLGALSFYAIMGVNIFEGKGGSSQNMETEIPKIGTAHANSELSDLIYKSLSYQPDARPSMEYIHESAEKALKQKVSLRKRHISTSGKTYKSSLVNFWPEEMAIVAILVIMLLSPLNINGQSGADIPTEMGSLVRNCVALRSAANKDKVLRMLQRDTKWTMMDELEVDKKGECSTKDPVTLLGLNSIGFRVLKMHNGTTNSGGRFRDGRDPRYKYSFIEITVKKGASVNYSITGREGMQIFAIVSQEPAANFSATLAKQGGKSCGKTGTEGICYLTLKSDIKKNDKLRLSIKNSSGKNMSFAIINYNSRNHE